MPGEAQMGLQKVMKSCALGIWPLFSEELLHHFYLDWLGLSNLIMIYHGSALSKQTQRNHDRSHRVEESIVLFWILGLY
eukprot:15366841-Ditylum_brightwellii.AAC.1